MGHWTASAQDTFIVNDDTTPAADGCDTPDFETEDIEDAIDSALVADGDTLVICEGTYNPPDAIEVTKALTIEGRAAADRDDIVVQGHRRQPRLHHLGGRGHHPPPEARGGGGAAGMRHHAPGADNTTIQDMEITAWDDGIWRKGKGNACRDLQHPR